MNPSFIPRHIEHGIWASFWRGGTSKGVFIHEHTLPFTWNNHTEYKDRLGTLLAEILGSPDPYGRQLNGLGGGISSLSKAVVYRPAPDHDTEADVEYTFVQIGIADGKLDISGNCGNLTSVVGPLALNQGLVRTLPQIGPQPRQTEQVAVRLRNLNTSKIIRAVITAKPSDHTPTTWVFEPRGTYAIDGVSGTASKVLLQFTNPGGAKTGKTLPTGNVVDSVKTSSDAINASLVDVTNPGIFIDGRDVGWVTSATPAELNSNTGLMARLNQIRRRGTEMMGLDPNDAAVPKIVLVYPPASDDVDITCQALSMETAHKAVPGTLALNLAASCKIPGTIPYQLARQRRKEESTVVIGHPSGKADVGATIKNSVVESVELGRTARCLMEGFVPYEPASLEH
ncbi:hypothetical protein DV736_g5339, partial [Chaetothyriales sp. CBS 134916]